MNRSNSQLKRSAMKRGTTELKRTEWKRVPGTARSELKRSRLNKVGPRTKRWQQVWRFLKPQLAKRDITSCEFGFIPHECEGPLDPAHSKKRGKMKGNDIYAVSLACRKIHNYLDIECSHEQMEALVMQAIQNRGGIILPAKLAA